MLEQILAVQKGKYPLGETVQDGKVEVHQTEYYCTEEEMMLRKTRLLEKLNKAEITNFVKL